MGCPHNGHSKVHQSDPFEPEQGDETLWYIHSGCHFLIPARNIKISEVTGKFYRANQWQRKIFHNTYRMCTTYAYAMHHPQILHGNGKIMSQMYDAMVTDWLDQILV